MSEEAKRKATVRRAILKALDDCNGYLVPEEVLRAHVELLVPGLLKSEFDQALQFLEQEDLVIGIRPRLGGDAKWRITDAGRTDLIDF